LNTELSSAINTVSEHVNTNISRIDSELIATKNLHTSDITNITTNIEQLTTKIENDIKKINNNVELVSDRVALLEREIVVISCGRSKC
jgi:type I site-specific restriction endonuclease